VRNVVTIKQLRKRLDRLAPRADAVGPDPTLAAQWDNSTAARLRELHCKTKPLTHEERLERAHLEACQDAWRRLHWPEEVERERVEREVYGWTDTDAAKYWELLLKDWRDTEALTPEERSELESLEAKRPPREDRNGSLAKAWD
jgi:hypothetical protein